MRKQKIFFLMLFILVAITSKAQSNYASGFYNVDSLFFELNWSVDANQELQYTVNQFTETAWQPYNNGIWLKTRPNNVNTWENEIYSRGPCLFPFNNTLQSGLREKVNVIRARLVDLTTQEIIKDSVYTIGIGNYPHTGYYTAFITVDSSDFANMMYNFNEDINIDGWVSLFNENGQHELTQIITFDIAAVTSACIANKGFKFKGDETMKTSIFTPDNSTQKIKSIKLRSGNGGQYKSFSLHEMTQAIIDTATLDIGGTKSETGLFYINGSYWSMSFFQIKPDNERVLEKKWDVDRDSIDVIPFLQYNIYVDSMYEGTKIFTLPGNIRDTVDGFYAKIDFTYDIQSGIYYLLLGYTNWQFFSEDEMKMKDLLVIKNPDGQKKIVAIVDEGGPEKFQPIAQRLNEMTFNTTQNYYTELQSLIDLDSWLRYLVILNYFHVQDGIYHNVSLALSHENKAVLIGTDWDVLDNQLNDLNANNWNNKIVNNYGTYDKGFLYEVLRMILRHPEAQQRLVLLYQDMVNQMLQPNRTTSIINKIKNRFFPLYDYNFQAWGGAPNGGQALPIVDSIIANFNWYLNNRQTPAIQLLTNKWQTQENLTVENNYHLVKVIFDSLPSNIDATVILNDDAPLMTLNQNFEGYYLSKPAVKIELMSDNDSVYIEEYPDSTNTFYLNADSTITLTLKLKTPKILQATVASMHCTTTNNDYTLHWSTTTEQHLKHFIVENSSDSITWDSVGIVMASGAINQTTNYNFIDTTSVGTYYRLKLIGEDNQIQIFNTQSCLVATSINANFKSQISIYPNPVKNKLTIKNINLKDIISVEVYNMSGKLCLLDVGNTIDVSILDEGMYIMQVNAKDKTYFAKIIKH